MRSRDAAPRWRARCRSPHWRAPPRRKRHRRRRQRKPPSDAASATVDEGGFELEAVATFAVGPDREVEMVEAGAGTLRLLSVVPVEGRAQLIALLAAHRVLVRLAGFRVARALRESRG